MRRDYPSEVIEIVPHCTKSGGMSRKLVSRKYLSITKSADIDDIDDPRYHTAVGIFVNFYVGVHGPRYLLVLSARNASPWLRTTLYPRARARRPGPTLVPWCLGGLSACPRAESTRKDQRPEEKNANAQKKIHLFMHCIMYKALSSAGGIRRSLRLLMKGK